MKKEQITEHRNYYETDMVSIRFDHAHEIEGKNKWGEALNISDDSVKEFWSNPIQISLVKQFSFALNTKVLGFVRVKECMPRRVEWNGDKENPKVRLVRTSATEMNQNRDEENVETHLDYQYDSADRDEMEKYAQSLYWRAMLSSVAVGNPLVVDASFKKVNIAHLSPEIDDLISNAIAYEQAEFLVFGKNRWSKLDLAPLFESEPVEEEPVVKQVGRIENIPTHIDKRLPIVVDKGGTFWVDELRCTSCNGRTIIKLPEELCGRIPPTFKWKCGHCKSEMGYQEVIA